MYYMLFSVSAIFLLSLIIGYRRGLLRSLLRVIAIVLSYVLTIVIAPLTQDYLYKNTEIDDYIEKRIYTEIETGIQKNITDSLEAAGVAGSDLEKLTAEETRYFMEEATDRATQMELISNMQVPQFVRDRIIENNNDSVYKKLGVGDFYHYISSYFTRIIVNAMGTAGTYLAIQLILLIICWIVGIAVKNVPIIAGIDRLGGVLLGAVVGLALVWIFMLVASVALRTSYDSLIGDNILLKWLNDNNLFMKLTLSRG